jgi:hypothetical protein
VSGCSAAIGRRSTEVTSSIGRSASLFKFDQEKSDFTRTKSAARPLVGGKHRSGSIKLALRERKRKPPIDTSDRGRVWDAPPAGDATTSKWRLASHESAVVVQSRLGKHGRSSRGDPLRERVRVPTLLHRVGDLPLLLSRHLYCSDACSERARREKKRDYKRRHQQGPGRDGHRERQRARRLRQAKGPSSKQIVTDHSSTEPPSDGTLVGARRQQVARPEKPSTRAAEANQDGSLSCRRCGRHSVLVEPLSERKRIVAMVRGRRRCQPRSARSGESSTVRPPFAGYVQAIEDIYLKLPITSRALRDRELGARQLHGEGVRPFYIEAALLVTAARQLLATSLNP